MSVLLMTMNSIKWTAVQQFFLVQINFAFYSVFSTSGYSAISRVCFLLVLMLFSRYRSKAHFRTFSVALSLRYLWYGVFVDMISIKYFGSRILHSDASNIILWF